MSKSNTFYVTNHKRLFYVILYFMCFLQISASLVNRTQAATSLTLNKHKKVLAVGLWFDL